MKPPDMDHNIEVKASSVAAIGTDSEYCRRSLLRTSSMFRLKCHSLSTINAHHCRSTYQQMFRLWQLFLLFLIVADHICPTICTTSIQDDQLQQGQASTGVEICYNDKGDMVKHGEQYIPIGINTCTQCTCMNGKAEMCISVLCSPPDNCRKYHVVTNKCCEFLCLDGDMQTGLRFFNKTILTRGEMKTYSTFSTSSVLNFVGAVRLFSCAIISAFLLIVFCVGCRQFRARREAWIRRFNQRQRLEQLNGTGGPGGAFGTGGGGPGHHLMNEHAFMRFGYFGLGGSVSGGRNGNGGAIGNGTNASTPFGFIEPPPPYTFWKPPEQQCPANGSITGPYPIGPGEAPPSYEETIGPNANQHSQQLPAIFQPSPTGATSETIVTMANNMNEMPPQPGINPQVQHLYQQQNQTPYQPMPIQPITNGGNSIINHSMNHHLFGDTRPSLINQQPIQTLPTTIGNNSNTSTARVISLTNAHLANLNTQPQSISANNNNNNNNNMGEESLSSTQTIRSNHKTHSYHMANVNGSSNTTTLVRHNSMPPSRSTNGHPIPQSHHHHYHHQRHHHYHGTNGHRPFYHHPIGYHHQPPQPPPLQQSQRFLAQLNDSNQSQQQHQQIYLQSTIDQHNQSHLSMFDQNQPIIDTVASDPNYEHITILRIGGPGNDNENGIGNNGIHHSGYYTLRDNRRNGLIGGTNKSGTYDPYTNGYSDFRRTFQRPLSLKPQQSQTDLISNRNINNEHSLESTDGSNRIGKNGYYLRPKSHSLRSINSHNGGSQIHQSKVNNVTNMKPQCKIVNSSSNHSFEHVNLDEDQRSKSTGSCSSSDSTLSITNLSDPQQSDQQQLIVSSSSSSCSSSLSSSPSPDLSTSSVITPSSSTSQISSSSSNHSSNGSQSTVICRYESQPNTNRNKNTNVETFSERSVTMATTNTTTTISRL